MQLSENFFLVGTGIEFILISIQNSLCSSSYPFIAFQPCYVHLQEHSGSLFLTTSYHAVIDDHVYRSPFNILLSLRQHRPTRLQPSQVTLISKIRVDIIGVYHKKRQKKGYFLLNPSSFHLIQFLKEVTIPSVWVAEF